MAVMAPIAAAAIPIQRANWDRTMTVAPEPNRIMATNNHTQP